MFEETRDQGRQLTKLLKGMGFTAIWISPIVAQIADSSRGYHGYSASNLYALNSNFGTASDLIALGDALHGRDMVRGPIDSEAYKF